MDFILKECDSDFISLVERIYNCNFVNFLYNGLDYKFISDFSILEKFHNIYLKVKDDVSNDLSLRLKEISDKYLFFVNKRLEYINGLNFNENNIIINHSFCDVSSEVDFLKDFSFNLNELLSFENAFMYDDKRIAGAIVITPVQTVCVLNDYENGHIGSGYHNNSFSKIVKAVYGESFNNNGVEYVNSWQDINVSISNSIISTKIGDIQKIIMDVEIPTPITSSQKKSLELLNEEIIKYELENDIFIEINSSLINHYNDVFFIEFECRNNLDDILKMTIVMDDYDFEYKDKNIIGFLNGENFFNNKYKIKQ